MTFAATAAHAKLTIYANQNFPQHYYLNPGQDYPHGNPDISFKLMNVPGQMGMFDSYEQTILYINIFNISGLPAGLSFDQDSNSRRPLSNSLYLFGTLPADVKQGVYTVIISGLDGAVPANTADAVIYLHIGATASAPVPAQQTPEINGNLGDTVPTDLPPLNKPINAYFTSSLAIDGYQLSGGTPPESFGLNFDPVSGNFSGSYSQAGNFTVNVQAHNSAGWSTPLYVVFNIIAITPPPPNSATLVCPTVAQLGYGIPPHNYMIQDSQHNTHSLTLTATSVGLLSTFYGAELSQNGEHTTLWCEYVSGSSGGPSIAYQAVTLPLQSSITGGNICLNKTDPSSCVITINL